MTTKAGDFVCDPMCGSGTTGAVCRMLGRRAILCDISEEYLVLTEKRLERERSASKFNYGSIVSEIHMPLCSPPLRPSE
jgi:site-specific DNA-methyltransferase (adenine-specific)